ncbi:hypothetical protein AVEN_199109-1 [Araneus ventricosus]|uniref:Uncharacterized protein n=1 Tax=Araneus ventricosus TaxID=182803 RepID=A0A4Y2P1L0_ARAVE|nr:hypothetical protein AVEN_199109-1 [Araneus ventricosus]
MPETAIIFGRTVLKLVNIGYIKGPTWIPWTVIEKTGPLSYKTVNPDGKSISCHIVQMRTRKTPSVTSQSSPETQENSTIPDPSTEIEAPKKAPDESHQNQPRITIIRPSYLKAYVM